ncbi:MAG TPA: hypothetical protein ENK14_08690 [Caldithrix sp.]|nr:hypothetical protein [Caldithrix sp.]
MKRVLLFGILIAALIASCGKKADVSTLQPGTPAYALADSLAKKIPYLDPEKNNVLVNTNDFKITTGDIFQVLQTNLGPRTRQLLQMPADRVKSILKQNAKQMGEKKLLLTAAKKANISATSAQVDSALEMSFKRSGGKEKYMEFLSKNNLSLDYVKSEIQKGLTIQQLFNKIAEENAQVTEEDIQNAYAQDKTASVRHILFSTQGKSDSEKVEIKKKAEEVLARARKGENFTELVKKYSDDPGSKNTGGLYEDFGRGKMVKPFEDAAFSVPIGKISDLVETRYGYHIVKVVNRKKETRPLAEVHDSLKNRLQRTKQKEAQDNMVKKLKEEAGFQEIEW